MARACREQATRAKGEVHATRAFDAFVRVAIERSFNEAKEAAELSAH